MSKKFSVDDFRSFLRQEVVKICSENFLDYENDTQRTEGFDRWIVNFFNDTNSFLDEDYDDASIGAKDDLGVDLYLEDDTNQIFYIIQTEFTGTDSKSKNQNIKESKVNSFFDLHKNLIKTDWVKKHGNEQAITKFLDYPERIQKGYQFKYYFISTGSASARVMEKEEEYNKKYERSNLAIQCRLLDFSKFKEYCDQARSLENSIPDFVNFKVPENKFFIKKNPFKTLIASIKANEIENLYRSSLGESLFSYNIREFLGEKGPINKDMKNTAETEPENFFYYNNGISAVCTKLELKNNLIKAHKFQIINGAQTVGALRHINSSDVEFLIRVTETNSVETDSGINEKIIRFNNSQNQITDADFRSNDDIQLFLEQKFKAAIYTNLGKINYLRKRRQKTKGRNVQNLKMEDLAKIRYAFLYEPCTVISKAKSLWRIGGDGKYYDTFGNKKMLTDPDFDKNYILPVLFYNDIIDKCSEEKKDDKKFMYLKRFRYHFLYFYKKLKKKIEEKNKKDFTLKKLLNDQEYLENLTNPMFERIKDKINDLYVTEEKKNKYKNAPIRDMTINKDHLEPLEDKILGVVPKIKY